MHVITDNFSFIMRTLVKKQNKTRKQDLEFNQSKSFMIKRWLYMQVLLREVGCDG